MNKIKCLVCGRDILWHEKLFYNALHQLTCLECNSIMKYSLTTNILNIIGVVVIVTLFSKALETGFNYFYALTSLVCLIILCINQYNAKLILVFKNGRFVKNV
jgi:hypothetical protein